MDKIALTVAAGITVIGIFILGFAGIGPNARLAVFCVSGGVAGAISSSFESEHLDAAFGTVVGFLLTTVIVTFLSGTALPVSFFSSITEYGLISSVYHTLSAIPAVAIISALAGVAGNRVTRDDTAD